GGHRPHTPPNPTAHPLFWPGLPRGGRAPPPPGGPPGPTAVCLPLRGLSTLGAPGGPYHDRRADQALFSALREGLRGSAARLHDYDTHINDPAFGRAAADRLHDMIGALRAAA
ncbi:Tm-1-like ATP-binding domain-containing protein, partial [Streptomyces goshikiensis]|uniref:Tm-1-like ATP-binding domain-containing protein n=1 Tax=Streptomyces goshikiensis TaxID=1942 RepID=UPI00365B4614